MASKKPPPPLALPEEEQERASEGENDEIPVNTTLLNASVEAFNEIIKRLIDYHAYLAEVDRSHGRNKGQDGERLEAEQEAARRKAGLAQARPSAGSYPADHLGTIFEDQPHVSFTLFTSSSEPFRQSFIDMSCDRRAGSADILGGTGAIRNLGLTLSKHSHDIRKSIARVNTAITTQQRTQLRVFYKNKKYKPLDLRPRRTKAQRQALTPYEASQKTTKAKRKARGLPKGTFVIAREGVRGDGDAIPGLPQWSASK